MKRLLWLGVGLAVGAIVVRKFTQKANEFTPSGIATSLSQSAGGLVESLRSFVDDVRDGMTEHAAHVTANVANLSTVVAAAAANPLIKVASFGYGLRKAASARRKADEDREVRTTIKQRRKAAR